jgi:hypothetical protein
VAVALSPDGATLLVLTSGFNRLADQSGRRTVDACGESVFVYDVTAGAPRQRQVIMLPTPSRASRGIPTAAVLP